MDSGRRQAAHGLYQGAWKRKVEQNFQQDR